MTSRSPIPPKLARLGIVEVSDNIPAGSFVGGIESDFVRIFTPQLMKAFFTTEKPDGSSLTPAPAKARASRRSS